MQIHWFGIPLSGMLESQSCWRVRVVIDHPVVKNLAFCVTFIMFAASQLRLMHALPYYLHKVMTSVQSSLILWSLIHGKQTAVSCFLPEQTCTVLVKSTCLYKIKSKWKPSAPFLSYRNMLNNRMIFCTGKHILSSHNSWMKQGVATAIYRFTATPKFSN